MAVLSSVKVSSRATAQSSSLAAQERAARTELAAAFRLAVLNNWHESIANHFSLAISDDGKTFLMNRKWVHFSAIRASDLLVLHADDALALQRPDAPDPSAWCIHGAIHAALPHARCILHLHPPFATALCSLADPDLKPIDQNTARFFNRLVIDLDYGGIADNAAEGARLARALGNRSIMIMGNHGVLVTGRSVAEAYDALYYLERACQTMVLAYSTGRPLNIMSDELAERTAKGWEDYTDSAFAHFSQMRLVLDRRDASYAD